MIDLSIIIATFNRVKTLSKTLDALDCQKTEYAFEVIVVDDGSTDDTSKEINNRIKVNKDPFDIRYFNTHKTNLFGASIARNMGIRNSRGKYIQFLDDDCIPHALCIENHIQKLNEGEFISLGYISYNEKDIKDDSLISSYSPLMQRLANRDKENNLTEFLSGNVALSKECFDYVGLFDERFARPEGYGYEDIEFGHRLIMGGYTLRFNPAAIVYTAAKESSILNEREQQRQKAKRLWWYVITHPPENLPITPKLKAYAENMKEELLKR